MTWMFYAFFSAIFAGLTALLAKIGMDNVPSNLATFIRTLVIGTFAFGIVFTQGQLNLISTLSSRAWIFLVLSGLATGISWLFYFAALKAGPLSGVAPIDKLSFVIAVILGVIFLGERVNMITAFGCALIVVGVLVTLPSVQAWFLD